MVYDQNGKKDSKAENDGLSAGTYLSELKLVVLASTS